jgi:protein-disulfide isomerase
MYSVCVLTLSLCAVTLTSLVVRNEVRGAGRGVDERPVQVAHWQQYSVAPRGMGDPSAPVKIVEFADFQCPYCARTVSDIDSVVMKYGSQVEFVYRYYPLERIHPRALQAAIIAECAASEVGFVRIYRTLYKYQDSLMARPPMWFARIAGVRDTTREASCLSDPRSTNAVTRDIAAGDALGVHATPTILVNQWRLVAPPTFASIDSLVSRELRR